MAVFNPPIQPAQDPHYLQLSKSIEQPSFSSSSSAALKGFGDIIEKAAKGADAYIEDVAKKDTRDTLEPMRDQFAQDLTTADRLVRYAANLQPQQGESVADLGSVPQNILDVQQNNVPGDIKKLPQTLETFASARASGKLTQTDFEGRTAAVLKDIRAKYPSAYRDVIDAEASKVLGGNPANSYIRSILGDINSFITNSQADRNRILTQLEHEGVKFPGGAAMANGFRNGTVTPDMATKFMAENLSSKYRMDQEHAKLTLGNQQRDTMIKQAEISANEMANLKAQETIRGIIFNAGVPEWQQLKEAAVKGNVGDAQLTSDQWNILGRHAEAYLQTYERSVEEEFAKNENGNSVNGLLTVEKANKIKYEGGQIFRAMREAFDKKDSGLAWRSLARIRALEDDSKERFISKKGIGETSLISKWTRDYLGDATANRLLLNNYATKLGKQYELYVEQAQNDLMTPDQAGATKEFPTMKAAVDAMLTNKARLQPDYDYQFPKTFRRLQDIIHGPDGMTDPKTPDGAKEQIFKRTFSPENYGLLRQIAPDQYQIKNGKRVLVPGSQNVFTGLTDPEVVAEAIKQGNKNPQAKANYIDFIETTADQDVLKPDVARLRQVPLSQIKDVYGFELQYNKGTGEFMVTDPKGSNLLRDLSRRFTRTDREGISIGLNKAAAANIEDSVVRVNTVLSALRNLGPIARQDGDGELYALETLFRSTGIGELIPNAKTVNDTTGFDILSIPGLPTEITQPIKKKREEELELRTKYKAKYGVQ